MIDVSRMANVPTVRFKHKPVAGLTQSGGLVQMRLRVAEVLTNPSFIKVSGRQEIEILAGGTTIRYLIHLEGKIVELSAKLNLGALQAGDELIGEVTVGMANGMVAVPAMKFDHEGIRIVSRV